MSVSGGCVACVPKEEDFYALGRFVDIDNLRVALALIGAFFLLMRPALLPEDARFLGSSVEQINDAVPALAMWLRRVFWVMGGFMVTAENVCHLHRS